MITATFVALICWLQRVKIEMFLIAGLQMSCLMLYGWTGQNGCKASRCHRSVRVGRRNAWLGVSDGSEEAYPPTVTTGTEVTTHFPFCCCHIIRGRGLWQQRRVPRTLPARSRSPRIYTCHVPQPPRSMSRHETIASDRSDAFFRAALHVVWPRAHMASSIPPADGDARVDCFEVCPPNCAWVIPVLMDSHASEAATLAFRSQPDAINMCCSFLNFLPVSESSAPSNTSLSLRPTLCIPTSLPLSNWLSMNTSSDPHPPFLSLNSLAGSLTTGRITGNS